MFGNGLKPNLGQECWFLSEGQSKISLIEFFFNESLCDDFACQNPDADDVASNGDGEIDEFFLVSMAFIARSVSCWII